MLKEKDLNEIRPTFRYPNGQEITLGNIQNALADCAAGYQIPVAFSNDQIKSGGLLNSSVDDCLIMYHPDHVKDYYKIAISVKRQGTMAFVSTYQFGESKNGNKLNAGASAKADLKAGWKNANAMASAGGNNIGMELMKGVAKGAAKGILSLGGSKAKKEEEQFYYSAIIQILNDVIS